jgi:cytochrome c-type biogenesis protein CcmH
MKTNLSLWWLLFLFIFLNFQNTAVAVGVKAKTQAIIDELASVTCENERLADCQSQPSAQLRAYIKSEVEAGKSKKQILAQIVRQYGPAILLAPPKTGFNLVLWLFPLVFALLGGGFLVFYLLYLQERNSQKRKVPRYKNDLSPYRQKLTLELKKLKEEG